MSSSRESNSHGRIRKSGRPRPLPPAVNARNLAIEKKRRGALNEKFLTLARLIPGLNTTQRLTKVLIVDESIRELKQQQNLYTTALQKIQDLAAENEYLSMEVDNLRSQTSIVCACSGNTGFPEDVSLQSTGLNSGIENDWQYGVGQRNGSMQATDANFMNTLAQSNHYSDVAEQSLQCLGQDRRSLGESGTQNYQTSSAFDKYAYNSHLDIYTSGGCIIENSLFNPYPMN